jgi:hypothetical protein
MLTEYTGAVTRDILGNVKNYDAVRANVRTIDVRLFANLSTAKASPRTAGKTIVISDTQNINTATIPTDRTVKVNKGGSINIARDKLLTLSIPVAGPYQIFTGSGRLIFSNSAGKDLLPEWWGCNINNSPAKNTAALEKAVDTAKISKVNIFHSAIGVYQLQLYYPLRQKTTPVVTVEDFKGIIVHGAGKNTIIQTVHPSNGCDVFQMNGSKNFTVKNLGVASVLPGKGDMAGSNGFSFTGGSSGITIKECYIYKLPYRERGSAPNKYLDGGKAFTIQQNVALTNSNIKIINNYAEGGVYGFDYTGSTNGAVTNPPVNIEVRGNTFKSFYRGVNGVAINGDTPPSVVKIHGASVRVHENVIRDCQQGVSLTGVTGWSVINNQINFVLPSGNPGFATFDSLKYGVSILSTWECNISRNSVRMIDSDYYYRIGSNQSAPGKETSDLIFTGNSGSGSAKGYAVNILPNSSNKAVRKSTFKKNSFSGYAKGIYPPAFPKNSADDNIITD